MNNNCLIEHIRTNISAIAICKMQSNSSHRENITIFFSNINRIYDSVLRSSHQFSSTDLFDYFFRFDELIIYCEIIDFLTKRPSKLRNRFICLFFFFIPSAN